MQIDGLIQALREDLERVAALGDENTSRAAELLSVAIESSLGRRIQDALAEAALELNDQLESSHVELRIAGHDLQLVLVREDGTVPEQADEAFSARITLRLPESLKQRVESAADIALEVNGLGSVYLGGFTFAELVAASRARELVPGAVERADALFATGIAPWCAEIF